MASGSRSTEEVIEAFKQSGYRRNLYLNIGRMGQIPGDGTPARQFFADADTQDLGYVLEGAADMCHYPMIGFVGALAISRTEDPDNYSREAFNVLWQEANDLLP